MFISTPTPSTLTLLTLLTPTLASPLLSRQAPNYPPHSQSQTFNLIANVTDPACDLTPSINNWVLSSYHIGAGEAYAVLESNSSVGRTFFVNGTAEDVRYNRGDLLSLEGTPLFPAGVLVDASNVTNQFGEHTVQINAGTGEAGVGLAQFPNPIPFLTAPGSGGYYACNNTLLYGPAIQLLYRYDGEFIPEGCAGLTLLPQCVVNGTTDSEFPVFPNTENCYNNVSAIDWTVYSA